MAEATTPGDPLQPLDLQEDQRQMQQMQQMQQQRQQQTDSAARNPPQPSPRAHSADHKQQPLGHRHQRRGDDKASKSGFFFNFGKSSKTPADRPIVVHQHSSSRADAMSRDSDRPALSKQSTKQSGTGGNRLSFCI